MVYRNSVEENGVLTYDFTEEEVFNAISQMEHNKEAEPDGFPAEFTKLFGKPLKWI